MPDPTSPSLPSDIQKRSPVTLLTSDTSSHSLKSKSIPWRLWIDHSHLYLVLPFFILLTQIVTSKVVFGYYVGEGADITAFYYGIINTWVDPNNVYNAAFYLDHDAWPYMYLPFFALLFYPMTLGGFHLFTRLFYGFGLVFFILSIILWDLLFQRKQIAWFSRMFFLSLMCMGTHYAWNFLFNQSKFYVIGLITLILVGEEWQWHEVVLHLLFLLLIALMTHLIFWYLYFIFQRSIIIPLDSLAKKKQYSSSNNSSRSFWFLFSRHFTDLPWRTIFLRFFGVIGLFLLSNCAFIIHPELILGYYWEIFGNFVILAYNYHERDQNSIVGYVLHQFGFTTVAFILTALIFVITFFYLMHQQNQTLLDALGWFCLDILIFDPLNEEHYFVFLIPVFFLWIAHNMQPLKSLASWIDWGLQGVMIFIILKHLLIVPPLRTVLYTLLVGIIIFYRSKVPFPPK